MILLEALGRKELVKWLVEGENSQEDLQHAAAVIANGGRVVMNLNWVHYSRVEIQGGQRHAHGGSEQVTAPDEESIEWVQLGRDVLTAKDLVGRTYHYRIDPQKHPEDYENIVKTGDAGELHGKMVRIIYVNPVLAKVGQDLSQIGPGVNHVSDIKVIAESV